MLEEAQSIHINLELFKDSNFFSPHPIAAGISNVLTSLLTKIKQKPDDKTIAIRLLKTL